MRVVVVANIVMSLDNVIAVAAAAEGQSTLLLGAWASPSASRWSIAGSALFLALIERFPIVIWGGGALLGWVAGGLLPDDPIVAQHFSQRHRRKARYRLRHRRRHHRRAGGPCIW